MHEDEPSAKRHTTGQPNALSKGAAIGEHERLRSGEETAAKGFALGTAELTKDERQP